MRTRQDILDKLDAIVNSNKPVQFQSAVLLAVILETLLDIRELCDRDRSQDHPPVDMCCACHTRCDEDQPHSKACPHFRGDA